jgi:hypothetical protein
MTPLWRRRSNCDVGTELREIYSENWNYKEMDLWIGSEIDFYYSNVPKKIFS